MVINTVLVHVNKLLALIRANILLIVVILAVGAHLFNRNKSFLKSLLKSRPPAQHLTYSELSSGSSSRQTPSTGASSSPSLSKKNDDLRRIRELQQQRIDEMAKIAAQERKKKADEERKRKNSLAKNPKDKWKESGGRQLDTGNSNNVSTPSSSTGRSSSSSGGYSPMQPWTASSAPSGGYRPQRRNVGRS